MKKLFFIFILFLIVGCMATLPIIPIAPQTYNADYEKLWNAAIDSVDELGFIPVQMQKNDGFITTERITYNAATYGIIKSATSMTEAFAVSASGALPGQQIERVRITVRLSKQNEQTVVKVNTHIEHQSGSSPWVQVDSNGQLEKKIQDKIADRISMTTP